MAQNEYRESNKKKKKKSLGFKISIGFLCVLLAFVVVGGGYVMGLLNKMDNIKLNKDNLGIVEDEFKEYDNYSKIKNIVSEYACLNCMHLRYITFIRAI